MRRNSLRSQKASRGNIFEAERLLEKRILRGHSQYLVKCKGYASKFNTWEPERNIIDKSLLKEFSERLCELGGGFLAEKNDDQNDDVSEREDSGGSLYSSGDEYKPEKKKTGSDSEKETSDEEISDEETSKEELFEQKKKRKKTEHDVSSSAPPLFTNTATASKPAAGVNQKSSRKRRQNVSSKRHRNRFHYIVEGCTGYVTNMYRHFLQVHVEIPEFEARQMIKNSKKNPKQHYQIYQCTVEGCSWKGTRPDKHLVSKAHKFEKLQAKRTAKEIKQAQKVEANKPLFKQSMHSAESLSELFSDWFESIEGGNYVDDCSDEWKKIQKIKQNKKYKSVICTVLQMFFGCMPFHKSALENLDSIGCPKAKGEKSVVEMLKEGRSWGTVQKHMSAFSHFLDFLDVSKPPLVDKTFIPAMKTNLKGSLQTVTRFALEELQHRKLDDRARIVDFEHITRYQKTNMAKFLSDSFEIEEEDSDDGIRDRVHRISQHVMLELALPNGKRAGIFNQMTCSEVQNAEHDAEGFVILVAEGKTFRQSGAAGVFCTKTEYNRLQLYIEKLRPLLKPTTYQVFCRRSDERASVSETGDFLKNAWVDFGAFTGLQVNDLTFTLIRKTLISVSRKRGVSGDVKHQMARHMDHSVETADRYYDTSTGVILTARFRETFNRFHDSFESDEDELSADVEPSFRLDRSEYSTQNLTSESSCAGTAVSSCAGASKAFRPESFAAQKQRLRSSTFGKLDVFTNEDKLRLYKCCYPLIEKYQKNKSDRGVTKNEILSLVQSAGPNFVDLLKNYTFQQLCNRVRCEKRKKN